MADATVVNSGEVQPVGGLLSTAVLTGLSLTNLDVSMSGNRLTLSVDLPPSVSAKLNIVMPIINVLEKYL